MYIKKKKLNNIYTHIQSEAGEKNLTPTPFWGKITKSDKANQVTWKFFTITKSLFGYDEN